MRTVNYSEVLEWAATSAGRVPSAMPDSERAMLRVAISAQLRRTWNARPWVELATLAEENTLDANLQFSRRTGEADEIGTVVGVWDGDPTLSTKPHPVGWFAADEYIQCAPGTVATSVWVDYMPPAQNLMLVGLNTLDAQQIPEMWAWGLALKAAALLYAGDGQGEQAAQYEAMGEAELAEAAARQNAPERWGTLRNQGRPGVGAR